MTEGLYNLKALLCMMLYFYSSDMIVREIEKLEIPLLEEFLYQAVFIPEGKERPGRDILKLPELQCYIKDFGKETDHCLVLQHNKKIIGAVWSRQFSANEKGFGFIDPDTPEIAMSVLEPYRNQGVGTLLLKAMLDRLARKGYRQVSLSVDTLNYAYKMYRKAGFYTVEKGGESVTMIKDLRRIMT
ncbi:MAG: GNAT family N-acetyltransferase [Bacteroidales bacterium]|jgi:ribosomal protein S18 acetylase RimI-like enzyme